MEALPGSITIRSEVPVEGAAVPPQAPAEQPAPEVGDFVAAMNAQVARAPRQSICTRITDIALAIWEIVLRGTRHPADR